MKLLFDQNLSPRLVDLLVDAFPDSSHVLSENLDRATEEAIWRFAREHDFVIVTKDSDFQERSQVARRLALSGYAAGTVRPRTSKPCCARTRTPSRRLAARRPRSF